MDKSKELVEKEHIKENEDVRILTKKQDHTFQKTFGMLKGMIKLSGQEIKDMSLWHVLHRDSSGEVNLADSFLITSSVLFSYSLKLSVGFCLESYRQP